MWRCWVWATLALTWVCVSALAEPKDIDADVFLRPRHPHPPTKTPSSRKHHHHRPKLPSSVMPTSSRPTFVPSQQPSFSPSLSPSLSPTHRPKRKRTSKPTTPSPTTPLPTSRAPTTGPGFTIDFIFASPPSLELARAFRLAMLKWTRILTQPLDTRAEIPPGRYCGVGFDTLVGVENLLIFVNISYIDGLGGVLGSAGPCLVDGSNMPRFGTMRFDSADVDVLMKSNSFNSIILHEMGHVLGIGTLWGRFVGTSTLPVSGGFGYSGVEGNFGNGLVGRPSNTQAVVEDLGGLGTARSHWKEKVYTTELMTGWAEAPGVPMPLSALTVGALADLGYQVDFTKADPFTVTNTQLRGSRSASRLLGCVEENHKVDVVQTRPK